jgi:hypothetical protein
MKIRLSFNILFFFLLIGGFSRSARAQFLLDMIDTTKTAEKGLWAIYRADDHLQISGYFQPQFQVAQAKGAKSYSGGDFSTFSNNRFMIRRARLRFDYEHFSKSGLPQAQLVFQLDGSERGVQIRDLWGRMYENRWQLFSFTTGMFARPFGYEVNLGSGDRESPERGRMSQILMRVERDLGAMVTLEPRKKSSPIRRLKIDVGVFNGQGLTTTGETDSYKDFIGRVSLKPIDLGSGLSFSGGASLLEGALAQNTRYLYRMSEAGGLKIFRVDSSVANIGAKTPRRYRGVDAQLSLRNGWGKTELRGEYWWGTQTAIAGESNTPSVIVAEPTYIREFNGVFLYLLQNIVNKKHQVIIKYDLYDPNRLVAKADVGLASTNTHAGDVQFRTFGFGYLYYFDDHFKVLGWYDVVKNEHTSLEGFTSDIKDNVFTLRLQYDF